MDQEEMTRTEAEITRLSNELIYRKYRMDQSQSNGLFQKITIPEYIALRKIQRTGEEADVYAGRTYLKDVSEKLHLSMRKTSNIVGRLKEMGLVLWAHDGNGSEGTYVTISPAGEKLLKEQEACMSSFYEGVIEEYGKDKLVSLLELMRELEHVIGKKAQEWEEENHESGEDK